MFDVIAFGLWIFVIPAVAAILWGMWLGFWDKPETEVFHEPPTEAEFQ